MLPFQALVCERFLIVKLLNVLYSSKANRPSAIWKRCRLVKPSSRCYRCSSAGVLMSERNCSAGWNTLDRNFRIRLISKRTRYVPWREHMGIRADPGIQRRAIIFNVSFVLSVTVGGTIYRLSAAVFWSFTTANTSALGWSISPKLSRCPTVWPSPIDSPGNKAITKRDGFRVSITSFG